MNNELTTTSILSLFDTTKQQRETFVADVVNQLESGNVDAMKVHYQVKCIENIIDSLNKEKKYKDAVLSAAETYGQKEFQFSNSKIKIGEVGVKYDYSQTGDIELQEWEKQAAELKEKISARQKMLQTIPEKGLVITNEESGETYTVYPPARSSTTSVIVTLK